MHRSMKFASHRIMRSALAATLFAATITACDRAPDGDALARAETHMALSAYAAARVELLNAARQRPTDPAVHLATSETLLQLGDTVGGKSAAEEARRLGGDPVRVAILLGDAANMAGDAAAALRHAASIPASHGADADRLRGGALMGSGEVTQAIAAYQRGLEQRPDDDRIHVELGYALLAQNDFAGAAQQAALAIARAPGRIGPHMLAARAAERQGDLAAALAGYDRVLAISGVHLAALQDRAAVLGDLNRPRDVAVMLDRADRVRPDHPRTLFLRAKLAASERRFREAQSLLARAGTSLDGDLQAAVLTSQIADALNMPSLAIAQLRRAVAIAPDEPQLRILLAQAHWRGGDGPAAEAALAPLARISPVPVEVAELRAAMAAGGHTPAGR